MYSLLKHQAKIHNVLTLKDATDDILNAFSLVRENKAWYFMWIVCLADDSHKMSILIYSENKNKRKSKYRLLQL